MAAGKGAYRSWRARMRVAAEQGDAMTTYLVTGATGLLGGQLVERLLADEGAEVHVVVREASRAKLASRQRRWPNGDRVQVVVGDLLLPELGIDPAVLHELEEHGVDHLVHLAA